MFDPSWLVYGTLLVVGYYIVNVVGYYIVSINDTLKEILKTMKEQNDERR